MPSNEIYRDMYSKLLYGLKWDFKRYEVHHLNIDHTDNRLENLVLLPFSLHKRYHMYVRQMHDCSDKIFDIDPCATFEQSLFDVMALSPRKFYQTKAEVYRFVQLRDFIYNSEWADLDFNHEFEKYFKLFDSNLYQTYAH